MRKLLCISHSGLADRIRLMLAGRKLAEKVGREFWFAWLPNHDCGAGFCDLFDMEDHHVSGRMPELAASAYFDGHAFSRAPWEIVERQVAACEAEHITLHSFADDQPNGFRHSGINFQQSTGDRVLAFLKDVYAKDPRLNEGLIGCHVRRTDKNPLVPLARYFAALCDLHDRYPKRPMFLATDDISVRRQFETLFAGDIFWIDNATVNRSSKEGMVDAIAELIVLRNCKSLVLTANSGFSMMAITNPNESTIKDMRGGVRMVENNRP
jgi:hypothetical protein